MGMIQGASRAINVTLLAYNGALGIQNHRDDIVSRGGQEEWQYIFNVSSPSETLKVGNNECRFYVQNERLINEGQTNPSIFGTNLLFSLLLISKVKSSNISDQNAVLPPKLAIYPK
jgi:hypothetical protein